MKALRECESGQTSPAPEARDESQEQKLAAALQAPASQAGRVEFGRYVGWVVGATSFVVILPTAFVWWLRSEGIVRSPLLTLVIALVATLAASRAGTGYWEKRTNPGDLLFGELLLWGFIRRCNSERRLNSARSVLGSLADPRGAVGDGHGPNDQAEALEKLSAALEATDPYTHGHSRRVARHCWMIAKRMGLDGETVARVRTAASLHDVGKVYTPASVLRKPGKLTDEEFDVIKRHPVDGAELVKALGDEELVSIVRHHHERLDGTGYPDRLTREQIPIGARIIAVADTFDAITSARPYRPARAHKKALDILKYEAGTQLDPGVVKAFCAIYSGRRPLAMWASFTSLPSQVFSWLGAGAATAASAAQVAAVAAAAAVSVTAAMQPHHASDRSTRGGHVQIAEVASHGLSGATYADTTSRHTPRAAGANHKRSASVVGGTRPGSPDTGPTSAGGPGGSTPTVSAPSSSQGGSGDTASGSSGGGDQMSHEGSSSPTETPSGGNSPASEVKGTPIGTGGPKPVSGPKEGKSSTEGKKDGGDQKETKEEKEAKAKEERQAKEAKEAKAREERAAKEAKAKEEKEAKEAKEAKAREEKSSQRSQGQRRKRSQRTEGPGRKGSQRSQSQGRKTGQRRKRPHQRSPRNGHRRLAGTASAALQAQVGQRHLLALRVSDQPHHLPVAKMEHGRPPCAGPVAVDRAHQLDVLAQHRRCSIPPKLADRGGPPNPPRNPQTGTPGVARLGGPERG